MKRFREVLREPAEIDAIQYDGYKKSADEIIEAFGGDRVVFATEIRGNDGHDILIRLKFKMEGGLTEVVVAGDWVMRDRGYLSVITDDELKKTYEDVTYEL